MPFIFCIRCGAKSMYDSVYCEPCAIRAIVDGVVDAIEKISSSLTKDDRQRIFDALLVSAGCDREKTISYAEATKGT